MKRLAELLLLGYAVVLLMGADTRDARFQRLGDKIMCTCSCAQMLLKCNHVGCPNSARMISELHALTGTGEDRPRPTPASPSWATMKTCSTGSARPGA